jgi:uncharacterized metal-binding protein YceD (DUF177 family)
VANKSEIKVYDCQTGRLVKVHQNLADQLEGSEISQVRQDLRHRKCYVADITGKIKVYNVSSGICLKDVTEDKKVEIEYKSAHGSSSEDEKEDDTPYGGLQGMDMKIGEITGMQLIWED